MVWKGEKMNSIIRTVGLCKSYPIGGSDVSILKNIEIKVEQGEFVSIIGPSGSGKSTLPYLLGGIDHPTSGKVFINNEDVNKMNDQKKSKL